LSMMVGEDVVVTRRVASSWTSRISRSLEVG
jgi:hypothetical protein